MEKNLLHSEQLFFSQNSNKYQLTNVMVSLTVSLTLTKIIVGTE